MATINQLKKHTSSLQSMIIMNNTGSNLPEVGKFLTTFYYTDRISDKIVKVEGKSFETENGGKYLIRGGKIYIACNCYGKSSILKNATITTENNEYTDQSF